MKKVVLPDYRNSLINLTSSIKKHFNPDIKCKYPSIDVLDKVLEGKKKVVLILLDGMGINIINNNLDDDSFLKTHIFHQMTSIFLSTTVAATNTVIQGSLPGENGWFGWHQYFQELDKNVIMFFDKDYYTEEAIDSSIKNKYVKMHEYGNDLNVLYHTLYPAFKENGFKNFLDMADKIINIINDTKPSFTYAYWEYPDGLIHEYGCYNDIIKANLLNLSNELKRIEDNMANGAICLVIADHGLIDVSPIDLSFYPNITSYLVKKPSLEGRATIFYTNHDEGFSKEFNHEFGKWFMLLTKDEFLASGLLGKDNKMVLPFVGDYIAIAKDKYYFEYSKMKKHNEIIKAHHAGLTEEEMMIPIILIGGKK